MGHGANPMGSTIAPPISVSISPSSARPPARRGEQVDEQDHQRREERRFLVLSEDWFSTPGFEWHPHSGLETVTLVLDGVLEHGDNLGNAGALDTGDIQWMTAGRGIIHRELAFRNERAHTLQLWVNLPGELKMAGTRYQDLRGPTARSSTATAPHRPDLRRRRRHLRACAEQLADLRDLDHPGAQPKARTPAARPRPRLQVGRELCLCR